MWQKWLKMDLFNPESGEYGSEAERNMLGKYSFINAVATCMPF